MINEEVNEITKLELTEYGAALSTLINDPNFRRVLVREYVETKPLDPGMMIESGLPAYNFAQGRRLWVHSVMSLAEQTQPAVYFTILQEVHEYEYRRRHAAEHPGTDDDE